jgi:hypothetical protein
MFALLEVLNIFWEYFFSSFCFLTEIKFCIFKCSYSMEKKVGQSTPDAGLFSLLSSKHLVPFVCSATANLVACFFFI